MRGSRDAWCADLSGRWLLLGLSILLGLVVVAGAPPPPPLPGDDATAAVMGDEAPNRAATCEGGDEKLAEWPVRLLDAT